MKKLENSRSKSLPPQLLCDIVCGQRVTMIWTFAEMQMYTYWSCNKTIWKTEFIKYIIYIISEIIKQTFLLLRSWRPEKIKCVQSENPFNTIFGRVYTEWVIKCVLFQGWTLKYRVPVKLYTKKTSLTVVLVLSRQIYNFGNGRYIS